MSFLFYSKENKCCEVVLKVKYKYNEQAKVIYF